MELSYNDIQRVLKLIDESHFHTMRLQVGDMTITVSKSAGDEKGLFGEEAAGDKGTRRVAPSETTQAVSQVAAGDGPAPAGAQASPTEGDHLMPVKSPMAGTFYRAKAPGEPPFISEGDPVQAGDTLCLLEVMKLFHSVAAEANGRVARILVADGEFVEYGQTLVLIDPEEQ